MQESSPTAGNSPNALRRVLLVDDDPTFLRTIGRNLAKSGFIVETAGDGLSGRDRLQSEVFDVVVSDLKMPRMDGLGLLDFVRRLPNSPKFLLLTGCGSPEATVDALAHGADQYVEKPVDGPLLARKINALFEGEEVCRTCGSSSRDRVRSFSPVRHRDRRPERESSQSLSQTEAILVLDDDQAARTLVSRVLQRHGYETEECGDAELALELAAARPFSAVVSDISMPGMDGLWFLRHLRERKIEVPVVFLTGIPSLETAMMALELGAFRYLTKPLVPDDLSKCIERAVNFNRMARLNRRALEMAHRGGEHAADFGGLGASLDAALEKMWLAFQPIVSSDPLDAVFGYEALLRSTDSTLSTPAVILLAAERLQRTSEVGRLVQDTAAATVADREDVQLFLNLHPLDLLDDELINPDRPLSKLAHRVILEVTERSSLEHVPDMRGRVAALRRLGYRIAIDDLGAGYAGLQSFLVLEPDIAKIDMSLVRDIDSSPRKRAIVKSMISVCRDLGVLARTSHQFHSSGSDRAQIAS